MAEHVANRHPLRYRVEIEQVDPGRYRLQEAQLWGGRKPGAPDMTDDDFRLGQQRGKMRRIALIGEYLGFQRRLHFGEDAWRDRGGEMAEKKRFHNDPRSPKVRARLWVL